MKYALVMDPVTDPVTAVHSVQCKAAAATDPVTDMEKDPCHSLFVTGVRYFNLMAVYHRFSPSKEASAQVDFQGRR